MTRPNRYFNTRFLEEVRTFFKSLDGKIVRKILYNIDLAEQTNDPRLLKKVSNNIWEFRIKYGNLQYRLLAFWDKTNNTQTLVVATHGIIKKTDKLPLKEIEKAESTRGLYFSQKN
ncbi:MAG TPA: type II toxin-antitoxin system RelE/ParE family toxin [Chitinophaga sp.]|uniref:type II toxin-antitoxin system RelE/ParE family toxin n=1 Tax=Chitinophaga sp. TaxID=1869181 RepID=UPI002DBC9A29|nr:type II toxin-antitoxin system RelE/ParE family toxin [Chitinophaga sp.]HEU4552271.1 type II toxin-antitoxin system RelE/ParE family toxin [Chitinophaga sp.]